MSTESGAVAAASAEEDDEPPEEQASISGAKSTMQNVRNVLVISGLENVYVVIVNEKAPYGHCRAAL